MSPGRIATKRKHLDLLEKSGALEDKLLELDRQRDEITQSLAEIDAELVYIQKVNNYLVRVLKRRD